MTAWPPKPRRRWLSTVATAAALALVGSLALALALVGTVAAADPTVEIGDSAFAPAKVTITAGQVVTWRNTSSATHTVTADDGSFESGDLGQSDQFANLFDAPGTYAYHCAIHPKMAGTVIVTAAPATPIPSGPPPPTPPPGTLPPSFQPYVTPTPEAMPAPTSTLERVPTPAPSTGSGPGAGGSGIAGPLLPAAIVVVVAAAAVAVGLLLLRGRRSA
jgi:plastocyanin